MSDLISRQDAIDAIDRVWQKWDVHTIDRFRDELQEAFIFLPSAQADIIIRCEECIHRFDNDCPIDWNGKEFCNFAER